MSDTLDDPNYEDIREEEFIKLKAQGVLPGFTFSNTFFGANKMHDDINKVEAIAEYSKQLVGQA